jgi:hypothetical protein
MSSDSELDGDGATVANLEAFAVDGAGYDEAEAESPSSAESTNPQ